MVIMAVNVLAVNVSLPPPPSIKRQKVSCTLDVLPIVPCTRSPGVSRSEKDKFLKAWRAAETATEDRKGKLAEAAALIERDFEIVGATAIEDKLQDGVPKCIYDLGRGGISTWMLTGDKLETAENIGESCKLLQPNNNMIIKRVADAKDVEEFCNDKTV